MKSRHGVTLDPATEIVSLIGSKEGIANMAVAFVDPGDVALVPDPGYPVYHIGTSFNGGATYRMPLRRENGFLPDLGAIPDEVARRAKLLWLNYPNNPTAAVAPRSAGGRAPLDRPRLRSAWRHLLRLGARPARPDRGRARHPLPHGGARRGHPGQRVRRRRGGIHPAHAVQLERAAARGGRAPEGPPPLAARARTLVGGGRHASSRLHRDRIEPGRPQGERPGSGRARREAAEHAAQPRLLALRERAARRRQDVVREQRDRGRDRVCARRAPEALEGDREGDGAQARQGQALGLAGDRPRHPPLRPGGGRDQILEGPPPGDAQTPLRPPAAGRAGAARRAPAARPDGVRAPRRREGRQTGHAPAADLTAPAPSATLRRREGRG